MRGRRFQNVVDAQDAMDVDSDGEVNGEDEDEDGDVGQGKGKKRVQVIDSVSPHSLILHPLPPYSN